MKKILPLLLLAGCTCAAAQTVGLKAGLWEMTRQQNAYDGQDLSAQMSAAQERMAQAMANMPPERRAQMEAMMGGKMPAPGAAKRICVSAQMAASERPMADPQGRCEGSKLTRSGNKLHFDMNCSGEGRSMVGKGDTVIDGDSVSTVVDATVTDARGTHALHSESQMKYLGADCQGLAPLDQLARGMMGQPPPAAPAPR
jgi:hypothetical protein